MPILNYKRPASFKLFAILILAVSLFVINVDQARAQTPSASPVSSGKYGSSTVDEILKYQKPQNHIQIWTNLAFANKDQLMRDAGPLLKYTDYFIFDFHNFVGNPNPDWSTLWDTATWAKALSPSTKLGFGSATVAFPPNHIMYPLFSMSDFLHKADGTLYMNGSNPDLYANLTSTTVRKKITDFYLDVLTNKPYDMVFTDSYGAINRNVPGGCLEGDCNDLAWWYNMMKLSSQDVMAALPSGKDFVYNGVFYAPPADTVTATYGGFMNMKHLEYHTGALSESAQSIITDKTIFNSYLQAFTQMNTNGKKSFFYIQPGLLCPTDYRCTTANLVDAQGVAFTVNVDVSLQRYYLAYFLLYQKNPYTYFGYHPGNAYIAYPENFGEMTYYADWYKDYGDPVGPYYTVNSPDLYWRLYSKGYAVVNNSTQPQQFPFQPNGSWREWDAYNGPVVSGTITIPPKSGKFFFSPIPPPGAFTLSAEPYCSGTNSLVKLNWTIPSNPPGLLDDSGYFVYIDGVFKYNNLQNPAFSDPVSKTSGQSYKYKIEASTTHGKTFSNEVTATAMNCAAPKQGDVVPPVGTVDIFDYNQLLTDFGKTGSFPTDIDKDGKVGIFDYNILLTNFGK